MQVRGYSPIEPEVGPSQQVLAANQALKLQELTVRKQELLSELQGYQVHRIPGLTCAHANLQGMQQIHLTLSSRSKNLEDSSCRIWYQYS